MFGLEDDLTPEDKDEIKKQNVWCNYWEPCTSKPILRRFSNYSIFLCYISSKFTIFIQLLYFIILIQWANVLLNKSVMSKHCMQLMMVFNFCFKYIQNLYFLLIISRWKRAKSENLCYHSIYLCYPSILFVCSGLLGFDFICAFSLFID